MLSPGELSSVQWNKIKFSYDVSGNLEYVGYHDNYNASDGDGDWRIYKYSYSGSDLVSCEYRVTSWTDRASGW